MSTESTEFATSGTSGLSFIAHRHDLDVYGYALESGLSDGDYQTLIRQLDHKISESSGTSFAQTPLIELNTNLDRQVLAKVETANVGGSHKARHLFGLLVYMTIDEMQRGTPQTPLAIASCGNAALGAATLTNALGRELQVFVPADANSAVLGELERLGANVHHCERIDGQVGDPCLRELTKAVDNGASPFTVQGPICPLVIDGGRTLGLELAEQLRDLEIEPLAVEPIDIYIQVGGGALGAATMDGLARRGFHPRLHPVQPEAAHPYIAMWERFERVLSEETAQGPALTGASLRRRIADNADLMQPWPGTPASTASGILDDITYDWEALLYHQVTSGGWPIKVSEDQFMSATAMLGDQVWPVPDDTGSAGFAGLLTDSASSSSAERYNGTGPAIVLVTGVDRAETASEAELS